ncbi:MAG: pyridoxal 5'-phosphate synthase glutaminase subunit PdxT [Ilumatobacteraceae bacterium]
MPDDRRLVGVLALQGAFAAHQSALAECGADTRQVRVPSDLEGLDALVMPGGESTTMSRLLDTSELFEPLARSIDEGLAVFGTCAGMILLASEVLDARPDQHSFAAIDMTVRRNGYGRQVDSFEADVDVLALDRPFHAVFIRAPKVERLGRDVDVIAEHEGVPVLVRSGKMFVASFHPELTSDHRLHSLFLKEV